MLVDKSALERWIKREFKATRNPSRPGEWKWHCPFCDPKKRHNDYTFNLNKQVGNCWRGRHEKCESGHNLLTLVAFYYEVDFVRAKSLIEEKFKSGPVLENIKRKLINAKNVADYGLVELEDLRIVWDMPRDAQEIAIPKTPGARVALKWLTETRKIPLEVVGLIEPAWLPIKVDYRWRKYNRRVLFPVKADGNRAWLAYSHDGDNARSKTMNPPGSILSHMLYLYDFYRKSDKPVILCEGIFDALRLFIFGYNAVALFGTAITSSQIQLLNRLPTNEVIVCLDSDASGVRNPDESLSKRADNMAKKLAREYFHYISIIRLPHGDPDDCSFEKYKDYYESREIVKGPVGNIKSLKRRFRRVQETQYGKEQ